MDTPLRKRQEGADVATLAWYFFYHQWQSTSQHRISYGLGGEGSSEEVLGGGEEASSELAEGEAGEGNSFMVTVTRLVVTSVTTTSLQLGAISGCQSGSPSAGTLLGSAGAGLWSPELTGSWRLGLRWRGFFLHSSEGTERSRTPSSLSPSKEEEGEEGRKEDVDAARSASEDRARAGGLALWLFWVSVWGVLDLGPSLEGEAPVEGWDWTAEALVGDFPSEPLELEGDGGVWYWEEVEWVSLAPVVDHVPGWEWKGNGPPHWSPNGFPYIGNPSIFKGGWKGL